MSELVRSSIRAIEIPERFLIAQVLFIILVVILLV
jgi:hypothetical protein